MIVVRSGLKIIGIEAYLVVFRPFNSINDRDEFPFCRILSTNRYKGSSLAVRGKGVGRVKTIVVNTLLAIDHHQKLSVVAYRIHEPLPIRAELGKTQV